MTNERQRCPRCESAELNNNHCPCCYLEYKPSPIVKLKEKLNLGFKKVAFMAWSANLEFYQRTKFFVLMIGILAIFAVVFLMPNVFVVSVGAWFALMMSYEYIKEKRGRKR